jgi:guanylate kinase
MLEWTIYNDHYYGIQLADFDAISEAGKIPMAAMDVPGALMMQEKNPQALVLFIAPDDLVVIKNRLLARGLPASDVERRMELTERDLNQAEKFNRVVVNKDGQFDATLAEVVGIIQEWLV